MIPDPNEAYSSENSFTVHKGGGFTGKFVKRRQRLIPYQETAGGGGSIVIADLMAPQAPSLDLLISNNAAHANAQIIEMENEEDDDAMAERQSLRRGQSQSVFGKVVPGDRQESQSKVNNTLDTSGLSSGS